MFTAERLAALIIGAVLLVLIASSAMDMTLVYRQNRHYEMPPYETALLTAIVSGAVYYVFRRKKG
jgi:hypothetical protein